jgi:hypothetical protein
MKQPRRLAAWLAAILMAASLGGLPREGAADPPFIDQLPPVIEGEPDGPPTAPSHLVTESGRWRISVTFQQGRVLFLVVPSRLLNTNQLPIRSRCQGLKRR